MEGSKNGDSEHASSSDDGQLLVTLRKMKKAVEVMDISTLQQVLENLIRKLEKEEIQSAEKKLLTGGARSYANEMTMLKERSLQLKFLDEVYDPVLTGKVINGKGGNPMMVALVDRATGQIVKCGPESSATVVILVLDATGNDNEHNLTLENFDNMIIREGDKKKPHFAKSIYVYLKEGVGILNNAKLGHGSKWMKGCKCRLGARIMENFRGIKVEEAWTESFMVLDSRSKLYKKHHPPSLSDEVWRLENIGRDGAPCKRLNNKENIWTVWDFLLFHSVDPQRLQQTVGAGAKVWKATVDHAWTCTIDDKRMCLYYPSTESKMGVIFDAVGRLKGVIQESHYVPMNNLSDDEKDCANKLRLSAFENQKDNKLCLSAFKNRKDITSFDDEASLLKQFPYRSSDINAALNSSIQEASNGCDLTISENRNGYHPKEPGPLFVVRPGPPKTQDRHWDCLSKIYASVTDGCHPTEPGTSSQSISPDNLVVSENINGYHPTEPSFSSQNISPNNLTVPENINGYHPMEPGTSSQSISTDNLAVSENINGYHPTEPGTSSQSIILDNLAVSESINGYHPTEPGPGTSAQSISADFRTSDHPNSINHFGSLESTDTGQLYDANLSVIIKFLSRQLSDLENIKKYALRDPGTSSQSICPSTTAFDLPNSIFHFGSLGSPTMGQQLYETPLDVPKIPGYSSADFVSEPSGDNGSLMSLLTTTSRDFIFEPSGDIGSPMSLFTPENNNLSETLSYSSPDFVSEPSGDIGNPMSLFTTSYPTFKPSGDNGSPMPLFTPENNNLPEILTAESHSHQQSNSRFYRLVGLVVNAKLWMVRAKGCIHVPKKRRINLTCCT